MLDFEELDFRTTPIGELSLRRRAEPRLAGRVIYEVKLDGDYLMSSLFTVGETALATRGLEAASGDALDVVVGGLGLGYTAAAALAHPGVRSLVVVEAVGAVIEWHRRGLVPLGERIADDPRCRLVCDDFFALARDPEAGFDHESPGRRFNAVLVDIDHSPRARLDETSRYFYSVDGLERVCRHLAPRGVFALWSDDPPEEDFFAALGEVFDRADAHVIPFPNPYTERMSSCTVYVAVNGAS